MSPVFLEPVDLKIRVLALISINQASMAGKKELKLAVIHLPLENKLQKVILWDGWPCPSDHKHEGKKHP